jgi:uncharacterized protein
LRGSDYLTDADDIGSIAARFRSLFSFRMSAVGVDFERSPGNVIRDQEVVMVVSRLVATFALRAAMPLAAAAFLATVPAQAQPAQPAPEARVIVTGDGSVSVAPDYARVSGGVITRGKSVKEASDANAKLMTAVTAALRDSGIEQKDIRTSRFSIQPVYAPPQPQAEPRLTGYSVSNQVSVTVHDIGKVGEVLDRMIAAGATDIGNVAFLIADPSKALDQAREAAVADARRKAELYARAAGLTLGAVAWITEDSSYAPLLPMAMMRAPAAKAAVPISEGEETLHAHIVVGYQIAR